MIYNENTKLKSLELFEEDIHGYRHHFLKGVWEYTTKTGRYELTIPRMELGSFFFSIPMIEREYTVFGSVDKIPFGLECLKLNNDDLGHNYYIKELEKFEREMTLEEIEKKLGHKVKLVSGKE